LANIVVLNEKANKTFSSKEPADYLKINSVDKKRLEEQLIPVDDNLLKIENYDAFLDKRASNLAEAASQFMRELKS
jgi:hypothetical protein